MQRGRCRRINVAHRHPSKTYFNSLLGVCLRVMLRRDARELPVAVSVIRRRFLVRYDPVSLWLNLLLSSFFGPAAPIRYGQGRRYSHRPVPSIYSIVPPNDGSALRHGHHFEPVDFVIDHGRGHHDAYSAGSCQRAYARACGCRQRPRCHREELIESEPGWSGREAFVTMMQTADLGQGNDRSRPGRLNGSSIRCVLAERQVGP